MKSYTCNSGKLTELCGDDGAQQGELCSYEQTMGACKPELQYLPLTLLCLLTSFLVYISDCSDYL
jgi:hypothetical protein